MEGGGGSSSRRRTRRQWDEYYLNLHKEKKMKEKESAGDGERATINMACSDPIVVKVEVEDEVEVSKDYGGEILRNVVEEDVDAVVSEIDEDAQTLRNCVEEEDDVGTEILKSDGGFQKSEEDGDSSMEFLGDGGFKKLEKEEVKDEDNDGGEISRNCVDDITEISRVDEDEDEDSDEDEDGDGEDMEFLREEIASEGTNPRNDAEKGDRGGNRRLDSCSRGKVEEIDPQIQRDVTVDSESSKGDSDESESESESETTSDDESYDEGNEREESLNSESSSSEDSENEAVDDVEDGVAENVNITKRAESETTHGENSSGESDIDQEKDDEIDERTGTDEKKKSGSQGESVGENLRNKKGTKQGKDEESDEGERSCNEHESEDETVMINSKEKFCRVGKRKRMNVERESKAEAVIDEENDEELEKEKVPKIKKSARKNENFTSSKCKENTSVMDEGDYFFTRVKNSGDKCSVKKFFLGSKKSNPAKEIDLIKILVDSINSFKEKKCSINENPLAEDEDDLPLRFRFEDEVVLPREKTEWEKHLDSLFCDLELGLRESENDCTNIPEMENDERETGVEVDESPAAACLRGEHNPILDEEIGIVCQYCHAVIMEIKHVLPPFHEPKWGGRDKRYYYDEFKTSVFSEIQFEGSSPTTPDSTACTKGTVWDLIPGVKKELYPHQREGFEFMWRNIGGDTVVEKLKQTLADDARGCIISHAPGTGKTRLTIVFLQSFMKLYPSCCPMIIAPKGMLLTWEAEFRKWNFNAAFHNVNTKELSGNENVVASELLGQFGNGRLSLDCIRLLKLYSWSRGGSILGISYTLFEKLAGEKGRGVEREKIREVLLERPDLLVLDEGHTPRNERSLIWKALTKVSTQRRIILSGTPFQNNLRELYNTLCVVNPKYADQETNTSCRENYSVARRRWKRLTNSTGINRGSAMKLREMLDPFVHVHKGTILEESLPGLSHTLVFLHPTETQKKLLENACKENEIFCRIRMVSLISVHPSINAVKERYFPRREETKFDIDEGVKARFLLRLIRFSDALKERVLVFSQFIDSLVFIKELLESAFSWNEGREVLYMDGQLDEKKRQESISCFNDEKSEAKVLLASERACSEGINLIGASRVVLLDTVWNPSVEKQAISRAYRIGQKKMVYVYRLFTSGIEVRQYAKQNQKERISQWIFAVGEGQSEKVRAKVEDKVLDGMVNLENFKHIFENIISQPTQSDLIKTFVLEKKN